MGSSGSKKTASGVERFVAQWKLKARSGFWRRLLWRDQTASGVGRTLLEKPQLLEDKTAEALEDKLPQVHAAQPVVENEMAVDKSEDLNAVRFDDHVAPRVDPRQVQKEDGETHHKVDVDVGDNIQAGASSPSAAVAGSGACTGGWTAGARVAAVTAATGAGAVGGGGVAVVGVFAVDAAGFLPPNMNAGEMIVDGGEVVIDGIVDGAEVAGEWIEGAAEDVGEWTTDVGEIIGEFVMGLF